ncbi:MAG: type II secretion system protein [Planctomycetota bacterium]
MNRHTAPQAFTLIELLVVVAIIALLIGLLVPTIGRARQSALVIQCLNSQRGLVQASTAYSTDYDGTLMPTVSNIEREEELVSESDFESEPWLREFLYWGIGNRVPESYMVAYAGNAFLSARAESGQGPDAYQFEVEYELRNHGLLVASYNVEDDQLFFCPAEQAQLFTRDEYPFPWLRAPQTAFGNVEGEELSDIDLVRSSYNYAPYNGFGDLADPTRGEWDRDLRDRFFPRSGAPGIDPDDPRWGMRAYRRLDRFPADRPMFTDQLFFNRSNEGVQSRSHYDGQLWNLAFADGSASSKRNPGLRNEIDDLILNGGAQNSLEILPGNKQQHYTREITNSWWLIHDLVNGTGEDG